MRILESKLSDILLSGQCLHDDDSDRAAKFAGTEIAKFLDRQSDAAVLDMADKAARDLRDLEDKVDFSDLQGIASVHAFKIMSAAPMMIAEPGDKATHAFFLQAAPGTPVYWPEHAEVPCVKSDFIVLTSGHVGRAATLFGACDWTHPSTLICELGEGFFGGFEVDHILYGKHAEGMFLVLYDSADIPLYKNTDQDLSDLPRLLGAELARRVLDDAGVRPEGSPEHYRKIELMPDEFYFSEERAAETTVSSRAALGIVARLSNESSTSESTMAPK